MILSVHVDLYFLVYSKQRSRVLSRTDWYFVSFSSFYKNNSKRFILRCTCFSFNANTLFVFIFTWLFHQCWIHEIISSRVCCWCPIQFLIALEWQTLIGNTTWYDSSLTFFSFPINYEDKASNKYKLKGSFRYQLTWWIYIHI